ncbi:MAG: M48 family metalloprotease [Actinomycetota bacterium]|nr:M48 family metalloprotease [Actinomycetota bacterium]
MYDRIAGNIRKSWMLVAVFFLLIGGLGYLFGYLTGFGMWGLGIAIAFSIAMTWGSYFASDKVALAMSRAVPADETQFAQLHNVVEGLSLAAGIPKPRVYLVEDMAPNAFATGRNPEHAAIALTTGLVLKMKRDELEGVVAHELAHVKNRDTLVMTLAVTLVGVVVLLADWMMRALWWGAGESKKLLAPLAVVGILLMVTAPVFAQLLQFAISRQREFLADADAVFLTRYPDGLIGALEKLRDDTTVVRSGSKATAHLWIEDPNARHAQEGGSRVGKSGAWLNRLFDTHPPLDQRIAALRALAPQPAQSAG